MMERDRIEGVDTREWVMLLGFCGGVEVSLGPAALVMAAQSVYNFKSTYVLSVGATPLSNLASIIATCLSSYPL